jgi:adenosylcobinamide-phosphate synthase
MDIVIILLLALVLDISLGEPPSFIHPVVWMGKLISFLMKPGKKLSPKLQLIWGIFTVVVTLTAFVAPVYFLLDYLNGLNEIIYIIVSALLFKTTFSLKEFRRVSLKIKNLLAGEKLDQAKVELRALVGRNTRQLDKKQLISATVESVAENSCDSFFAPLLFFALLGVPGAVAYRIINTLDSMIGHHGEYEYLGKFAAKLDTIVNLIPARIAAMLIVVSSWICRARPGTAWKIMRRDSRKTESPNAGWTMSAMAGALDVQLEKVDYYRLGDDHNPLSTESIDLTLKIMLVATSIWSIVIIIARTIINVTA